MSDLADLFPGFEERRVQLAGGVEIYARIGGEGPPLLLLHGYPQTHVAWHRIAPGLAARRTVVAADLRGYGASSVPADDKGHTAYSKRTMAADMAALMDTLGHPRFDIAGHDRGGRVACRMALDTPERVNRIAVLDIVPTHAMWKALANPKAAMRAYHWFFLAQPAPHPERLIAGDAVGYLERTLAAWTAGGNLKPFHEEALAQYRAAHDDLARIAATCADYRAGWHTDRAHDEADLQEGRTITAPILALWGRAGFPDEGDMLAAWRSLAPGIEGRAIDAGHFLMEEAPEETLAALDAFFAD